MSDLIVYRSTDPAVIEAYETAVTALREWRQRVDAFVTEHGGGRDAMSSKGLGHEYLIGFRAQATDEDDPPAGWRVEKSTSVLVPDKRTAIGKDAARELKDLGASPGPPFPGMPSQSFGGGRMYTPGVERHRDTVYVRWSAEPDPAPDPGLWERCPLSVYYAVVEAAEAASCA